MCINILNHKEYYIYIYDNNFLTLWRESVGKHTKQEPENFKLPLVLNTAESYHKNNTYVKINFHLAIYNIYMLSKLTKILISTKIKNNRYYVRGVAL